MQQCTGKGKRFDWKNSNMTLAAVAGTTLFAGNIKAIPLTDFKTALIDFRSLSDNLRVVF